MSTTSPSTSSPAPGSVDSLRRLIVGLPDELLTHVFTHSSWASDRAASYERLEFLGDSVLELAVARTLYDRFPEFSEGRLAKIRSHVVSRASCAVVARELDLDEQLRRRARGVSRDEIDRLARNRNVLAALLEAALAGVFLRHGFEESESAIVDAFSGRIEYALTDHVDYKTELQEAVARRGGQIVYTVLEIQGPPHERIFTCAAVIDGEQLGVGTGSAKKTAEQTAAKQALEQLATR
ncbi:MAG: ribonuclease III [Gaiellaceae bacterium]